jgi:hypothetical protein
MPQRAMLEFAGRADNRALAVAFDRCMRDSHRRQQPLRHIDTDRLERLHGVLDVGLIATRKRIGHHGSNRAFAQGMRRRRTELVKNVFDVRQHAAYFEHGASVG